LLTLALPVGAQTNTTLPESEAAASREFSAFLDSVPPELADLLPKELFEGGFEGAERTVREQSGVRAVFTALGRTLGLSFRDATALLSQICGILLLGAVFRALVGKEGGGTGTAFSFCTTLATTAMLLLLQKDRFGQLSAYFNTVKGLSLSFLPLMGTLYAMGGNVRTAVVNQSVMSTFLTLIEAFCAGSVPAVAGICLSLSLLHALSGGVDLRPLCALIKRTYTLTLSFLMLLLCGILGLQSTLAKASDTLALRTARFAAGSFLPVVGGSVSESLRTVAASVEYLRSVSGGVAILLLFLAFLPVFCNVTLTRVAFLLGGATAKMLCCDGEERILSELGAVYGYFMAIIAVLFVMTVFSLTLFARCAAAG
jgi:stage III sporulation protein AE